MGREVNYLPVDAPDGYEARLVPFYKESWVVQYRLLGEKWWRVVGYQDVPDRQNAASWVDRLVRGEDLLDPALRAELDRWGTE